MADRRKAVKRTSSKSVKSYVPQTNAEKAEAFDLLNVLMGEIAKEDAVRELVAEAVIEFMPKKVQVRARRPRVKRR